MARMPAGAIAALNPDAIADLVRERVRAHARRLGTSADGDAIAAQVHELVRYARGDGDAASAGCALAHAVPALYGCAADEEQPGPDHLARLRGGVEATSLDLALHLAWARWRIATGEPIPVSALVVLGGYALGTGTANRLVRAGEIDAKRVGGDWVVDALGAQKWLARR